MPRPTQTPRDLALLVGRLIVGAAFLAHGLQKFLEWGIGGTATTFDRMGVPLPEVSAWISALVETLGGLALILGLALPVVGVALAAVMLGAMYFVHLGQGFFAADGGIELVLVLGASALALGFNGGRFAVDRLLNGSRVDTDRATV
ncbi:DoxX family protein [Saccharomonospora halophila]|uniref:DoxX family protein n=1 Tax=Saccharomonospora halophila TaxID=129922 RepID=UPI000375AFDA|nr:DoxX family protein [Saccharomonospora halophila]